MACQTMVVLVEVLRAITGKTEVVEEEDYKYLTEESSIVRGKRVESGECEKSGYAYMYTYIHIYMYISLFV